MEGGAAAGGASEGGAAAGGASEGGAAAGGASEGGAAAGGASVFIRCPNNARIETITPVTTKKCMPHPGLSAPVWGGNPMAIFGSAIMAMTQNYCPFCF